MMSASGMTIMMGGMGLVWLLVVVALVLVMAAAIKYLFLGKRDKD
jgi:hypothetical protein